MHMCHLVAHHSDFCRSLKIHRIKFFPRIASFLTFGQKTWKERAKDSTFDEHSLNDMLIIYVEDSHSSGNGYKVKQRFSVIPFINKGEQWNKRVFIYAYALRDTERE